MPHLAKSTQKYTCECLRKPCHIRSMRRSGSKSRVEAFLSRIFVSECLNGMDWNGTEWNERIMNLRFLRCKVQKYAEFPHQISPSQHDHSVAPLISIDRYWQLLILVTMETMDNIDIQICPMNPSFLRQYLNFQKQLPQLQWIACCAATRSFFLPRSKALMDKAC